LTLATVNSNIGTFGTSLSVPSFTVNAKGLITGVSGNTIPTSNTTTLGLLSSTDWNTFNNKQSLLTNPVTGTGTTNYLTKFTGTSAIGNSVIYETNSNILIGTTTDITSAIFNITSTTKGFLPPRMTRSSNDACPYYLATQPSTTV
jgi:GH15 family glucan-1,4-alpha-glucosidase